MIAKVAEDCTNRLETVGRGELVRFPLFFPKCPKTQRCGSLPEDYPRIPGQGTGGGRRSDLRDLSVRRRIL